MSEEMYRGAEYRFPCSMVSDDVLVIQAHERTTKAGTEAWLWLSIETDGDERASVGIGPNHLNEFHSAINAALAAVADNGNRLIEEHREEAFKRLYLNEPVEASKPEPVPTLFSEALKNAAAALSMGPSLNDLFPNAASRAARDE